MLTAFVILGISVSVFFKTFRWSDLGLAAVTGTMSFKSGALLQSSSYYPPYENWSAKFISGNLKGNRLLILRCSSLLYTFVTSNTTQILLPVKILKYF